MGGVLATYFALPKGNKMANCDSPRIKGFLLQRPIFVSVSDLDEQVELVELVG